MALIDVSTPRIQRVWQPIFMAVWWLKKVLDNTGQFTYDVKRILLSDKQPFSTYEYVALDDWRKGSCDSLCGASQ
jgi:hypothetical protein